MLNGKFKYGGYPSTFKKIYDENSGEFKHDHIHVTFEELFNILFKFVANLKDKLNI